MSISEGRSTALAPGVRVRPWRHHLAAWDLAARTALHAGVAATAGRLLPSGPARPAAPEELALLDGAAQPSDPALEVFTSPALLRQHFWSLDPDELPAGGGTAPSAAWQGFAEEVRAFLKVARVPLPGDHALLLAVRDPAAERGLWEDGPGRALLQAGPREGPRGGELPRAVWLNLSDVPTALVFFNVPVGAMAGLLGREPQPGTDAPALVRDFAAKFPRCPLVRLTLQPGDGVLIPLLGLAVDGDPRGAADLDVSLVVLPSPARS